MAGLVCDSSYRSLRDTVRHHLQLCRALRAGGCASSRPGRWRREVVFWIGRRGGFDPDAVDVAAAAARLAGPARPVRLQLGRPAHAAGDRVRAEGGGGRPARRCWWCRATATAAPSARARRPTRARWRELLARGGRPPHGRRVGPAGQVRGLRGAARERRRSHKKHHVPFPEEDNGAPEAAGADRLLHDGRPALPRDLLPVLQGDLQALGPGPQDQGAGRHRRQPGRQVPGLPGGPHQEGAEVRRHAARRSRSRSPSRSASTRPPSWTSPTSPPRTSSSSCTEPRLDDLSLQERYAPAEHLLRLRPGQPEGTAHPQLRRRATRWSRLDARAATTRRSPACSTAGSSARCSTATATGPPHHLMRAGGAETPPCTVTADYAVKLRRPTPSGQPVQLRARVVESAEDRAVVEATLGGGRRGRARRCRGHASWRSSRATPRTTAGQARYGRLGGRAPWRLEPLAQPVGQGLGRERLHVHDHRDVAGVEDRACPSTDAS